MIWRGIDLIELGMAIYLIAHVAHGVYRVEKCIVKDFGIAVLWMAYTLLSLIFLRFILMEVRVDDVLIDRLTAFISQ